MADKKSFISANNPVMNFLSAQPEEEQPKKAAAPAPKKAARRTASDVPDGYKYTEKRTKRFQCVVQPSLYAAIEARAKQDKTSINNLIHTILEKELKESK